MRLASDLTKDELISLMQRTIDANAVVRFEDVSPVRFVGYVVSHRFEGMSEHERQALVWDAVRKEFDYADFEPLALVLTITPAEYQAISTEQDTIFHSPIVRSAS
jgi:acid stress-induced BolA-like protein IbaG/YrbA